MNEPTETTKNAADLAYKQTNLTPDKIQVAEVHDCFTIAEVLMYEALGFANEGRGLDLAKVRIRQTSVSRVKCFFFFLHFLLEW